MWASPLIMPLRDFREQRLIIFVHAQAVLRRSSCADLSRIFSNKNFPRERIAVGVQAVRGKTENHVARFDLAAVDHFRAIDHADDATGEIVFAVAIHSRHLRGFAADQRATGRATGSRKSAQELIEHARLEFFAADVIEKEQAAARRAPRCR